MRLNPHNGDRHLRADQRAAYLALNAADNLFPRRQLDGGLRLARFHCDDAVDRLRGMPGTPSPSRAMCDLFWMHLPWSAMERELGPLRMLDLGCGSGGYAARFAAWSDGRIASYVGVDVQARPEWVALAAQYPFVELRPGDIEQLDAVLPADTNLIVSQSTLEHVGDEFAPFDRIHAYAHARGRPLLQIHAVPSAACLRQYLWHGYRQYTPRTVSAITRRFADCSDRMLVALGGAACNALHWKFVTWPLLARHVDRRDADPTGYRRALEHAVTGDLERPDRSPAFYAVLIFSNGRAPLLSADWWREGRALPV